MDNENGGYYVPLDRQGSYDHEAETQRSARRRSLPVKALTSAQQSRLIAYLDERFLEVSRGVKKRHLPDTSFPTLSTLLTSLHPLLTVILLIPPYSSTSSSLRTTYLLRLTLDVSEAIGSYGVVEDDPRSRQGSQTKGDLDTLLGFLDSLDRGWEAVLKGLAWDPVDKEGWEVGSLRGSSIVPSDRTRDLATPGLGLADSIPEIPMESQSSDVVMTDSDENVPGGRGGQDEESTAATTTRSGSSFPPIIPSRVNQTDKVRLLNIVLTMRDILRQSLALPSLPPANSASSAGPGGGISTIDLDPDSDSDEGEGMGMDDGREDWEGTVAVEEKITRLFRRTLGLLSDLL